MQKHKIPGKSDYQQKYKAAEKLGY